MNKINLNQAYDLLINHQPICVSTDTVLGIATLVEDQDSIYQLKQRDEDKKIIYLIPDCSFIPNLDQRLEAKLQSWWPGNVSVIIDNQGYRIPNHQPLLDLLNLLYKPLAVSSANLSGQDIAVSFEEVNQIFPNLPVYGDDQNLSQVPSTIFQIDEELNITQLR